jgi:hypothetical protein
MRGPGAFGSGSFSPRPLGVVSWCIIAIERDTSKCFPTLPVAEIPFDVRQNRCTKELRIVPYPGTQNKKTVDARRRANNGPQALLV